MVKRLLDKLRTTHPDGELLLVLDNARYQRAYEVQDYAAELGIDLFFLPPYSPNLNLIERLWKFTRKHVTRNKYYATFAEFREAVERLLANLPDYVDELASLMTENFHLFGQSA